MGAFPIKYYYYGNFDISCSFQAACKLSVDLADHGHAGLAFLKGGGG